MPFEVIDHFFDFLFALIDTPVIGIHLQSVFLRQGKGCKIAFLIMINPGPNIKDNIDMRVFDDPVLFIIEQFGRRWAVNTDQEFIFF